MGWRDWLNKVTSDAYWYGDIPRPVGPVDPRNAAQTAYEGNRQLQKVAAQAVIDFTTGSIPYLVEKGREANQAINPTGAIEEERTPGLTQVARALGSLGPGNVVLDYLTDGDPNRIEPALRGFAGQAVEEAAPLLSGFDLLTLGTSAGARAGAKAIPRSAARLGRVAKEAEILGDVGSIIGGGVQAGTGLAEGDVGKAATGTLVAGLGSLGRFADRAPVGPVGDLSRAQVASPAVTGVAQPFGALDEASYKRMGPIVDDFAKMADEIYQAAVKPAASRIPDDALSHSVGEFTNEVGEPDTLLRRRGTAAERADKVRIGLTQEPTIRGYTHPDVFAGGDPKGSEIRVAATTLIDHIGNDIAQYPHFADMMQDSVKVGQELLRRMHRNMVHEVVHAVDMQATHPDRFAINASDKYIDPVTGKPSGDTHSGQQRFDALEGMVKYFLKSTEIDEVTAKYAERALPFIRKARELGLSRNVLPGPVGGVGGPTRVAGKLGPGGRPVRGGPTNAPPATRVVDAVLNDAKRRGYNTPVLIDAFRVLVKEKGVGAGEADRLIKSSMKVFGDTLEGHAAILRAIRARPPKGGVAPPGGAAPTPSPGPRQPPPPSTVGPAVPPGTPPPPPAAAKGRRKRGKLKEHGWEDMVNQNRSAPIKGKLKREEFRDLDNLGVQGMIDYNKEPLANPRFKAVKQFTDDWLKKLRDAHVPLREKDNYLPQVWEDPPSKVAAAMRSAGRRLGIRPSFTMEAVFKNYEEGIAAGLTPKYKTISELLEWYETRANSLIADRLYFHWLKNRGMVKTGRVPEDWQEYSPRYFPKARVITTSPSGKKMIERTTYKGPPDEVEKLRQYFEPRPPVYDWLKSRWTDVKNLMLSSGIPLTGFNAYGYKILKRIGDVKPSFIEGKVAKIKALRLFADRKFAKRELIRVFKDPDVIAGMDKGLTMGVEDHPFTFDHDSVTEKLKEAFSHFKGASLTRKPLASLHSLREFHKVLFEDDLFGRVIPVAKATVFKSNLDQLVKAGIPRDEALRVAAINTNNTMTGINTDELIGKKAGLVYKLSGGKVKRGRDFQDVMNFALIAPSLLESNMKTGAGIARALMNPKDPRGRIYRNVMKNVALTYLFWNTLYLIAGKKSLMENPEGRKLGAPMGETAEGRERYLRTNLQEHDWFRLPLEIAERAADKDLGGIARVVGNRVHPMMTALNELFVSRRDYTGKPLYGAGQSIPAQLGNVGSVVASTTAPSYVQAAVESLRSEKKGFEEGTAKAFELPLMYSARVVDRVGGSSTSRRDSRRRRRQRRRSRRPVD